MGWGTFYEVSDSARGRLSTCRTKSEWYEALGALSIESSPQLDAEESISFWVSKLESIEHPLARFFEGDMHAEYNEYDDPNVCYVGNTSTNAFLTELNGVGKEFFVRLFPHNGPYGSGDSWLYEPLCKFLRDVCARNNGVIILWEA